MSSGPRVFISYAWESETHAQWVEQLATRLRDAGAEVLLDKWLAKPGADLGVFMEKAVTNSDIVIPVCTPEYKLRSEGVEERGSGVFFEVNVMRSQALVLRRWDKFVPVLRSGEWPEASPAWLLASYYITLTEDAEDDGFAQLARRVLGDRAQISAESTSGLAFVPIVTKQQDEEFATDLEDDLFFSLSASAGKVRRVEASRDLIEVGRKYKASHVLFCKLRRREEQFKLESLVIDTRSGQTAVTNTFTQPTSDPEAAREGFVEALIPEVTDVLRDASGGMTRPPDPDSAHRMALRVWRSGDESEIESSEAAIREVLEADTHRADLWAVLALLLLNRWKRTQAESVAVSGGEAVERSHATKDVPVAARLARWAWAMAREDLTRAQRAVDALVESSPHSALSHLLQAETGLARGDLQIAAQAIDTAIRLEPYGHVGAYQLRQTIRERRGLAEAAERDRGLLARIAEFSSSASGG